jgi:hypothetical protein
VLRNERMELKGTYTQRLGTRQPISSWRLEKRSTLAPNLLLIQELRFVLLEDFSECKKWPDRVGGVRNRTSFGSNGALPYS